MLWKYIQQDIFRCHSHRDLRLIDKLAFRTRQDSMELSLFQNMILRQMEAAKDTLFKK